MALVLHNPGHRDVSLGGAGRDGGIQTSRPVFLFSRRTDRGRRYVVNLRLNRPLRPHTPTSYAMK
jgi:hypothetical protein